MQRHKRRGNGDRSFQSGGAGKGDADRSPGWREHYHDIDWPDGGRRLATDGFIQRGGRLVKHYGVREPVKNTEFITPPV